MDALGLEEGKEGKEFLLNGRKRLYRLHLIMYLASIAVVCVTAPSSTALKSRGYGLCS